MTRKTVLVTGGAGFIGSNIVAKLCEDPSIDVVVCDRLRAAADGKWRNLAKSPIADFVAPEDLFAWLAKRGGDVELVIHMGAVSSTTEPDADKIIQSNFVLSRDLWRWCAQHQRRHDLCLVGGDLWRRLARLRGLGRPDFAAGPAAAERLWLVQGLVRPLRRSRGRARPRLCSGWA
jgi:NAD(P)-dependent dehydrogenase (short-subunit alcohol dehydrogenase family)